jgi:hypothetical protein
MTPRISPPRVFPEATRAARPPAGAAGAADSYRQAGFLFGNEIDLLLEGFMIEGSVAAASAAPRYRTQLMAGVMGLWSRGWLCRLEALHAAEWGNYAAAIPLIRAAADATAAEALLLETGGAEWSEWVEGGGIALASADHATEYRLHAFRAAEILAAHPRLGPLYRVVSDLSMPHFGATLMLAGGDSGPERVAITFGDRDFHFGLVELVFGWLLELSVSQAELLLNHADVFNLDPAPAVDGLVTRCQAQSAGRDRCRVETVEHQGERRYLVLNWRRAPGGAPKRLLL